MIDHYSTKPNRRPRNKRRKDYTAQTMAALKKHAAEDETVLPFVRLNWTQKEVESLLEFLREDEIKCTDAAFERLLTEAAKHKGPPKDIGAWAKKLAEETGGLND